ncbi:MAG: hypothetical protein ABFD81_04310 [Syntrophaceae bacterium]
MESTQERHQRELFRLLHETALSAGLVIIEDKINRRGGVCRLDEKVMVIYDVHAPARERNRLILGGLTLVDLENIYVPPKVREMLGEKKESETRSRESGEGQATEVRVQESADKKEAGVIIHEPE